MTYPESSGALRERDLKGSRLRCLLLTSGAHGRVAEFLNSLVAPHAQVTTAHHWVPRGLTDPGEAKLGESTALLSAENRTALTSWWLAHPDGANTPNWDIASSCLIKDRPGLLLVEAKAHEAELSDDRCGATNQRNLQKIESALAEATVGWNALSSGFALSANSHYQLSNRFAFAWKVAKMGIPAVLVYLGFCDAHEMDVGGRVLFKDHATGAACFWLVRKGRSLRGFGSGRSRWTELR